MRAILAACLLCLSVAAFAGQPDAPAPADASTAGIPDWGALAGRQPDAYSAGLAAYKTGNYSTALADWRLGAQQGDARAQFDLGYMYANGQGLPQDYAEALKWFRLAAQQGNAVAQYNLGVMYDHGQGVPQDYAKAMKWYRLAARQGFALAQGNLGAMYAKGQGVPQDYVAAYKWNALAKGAAKPASKAYKVASANMSILSKRMTPAQIAQAQQEASAWWAAHHKGA